MVINAYSLIDFTAGITIGGLALTVYLLGNKARAAQRFCILSFFTALWSIAMAIDASSNSIPVLSFILKFCHYTGTLIASSFLLFSFSYPNDEREKKLVFILLLIAELIFFYLIFFTNEIVGIRIPLLNSAYYGWQYGPAWFLFHIYFCLCWTIGIIILFKNSVRQQNNGAKKILKLMILAFIIGIIPPFSASILLPRFGIFDYYWIGPIAILIWTAIMAYSIAKHHLFNIKLLAIEIVTFALWIFILIRTLLAQTLREAVIEASLLGITVIFGVLLIKSVLHEIEQREKIERLATNLTNAYADLKDLNQNLERKVAEQTQEVRQALEVEKRARGELEKLNAAKDHFITTTQHHLRTPLTSLRWDLELIKKSPIIVGDRELADSVGNADASVAKLGHIIENFIAITETKEQ